MNILFTRTLLLAVTFTLGGALRLSAAELQKLSDVRLLSSPSNDGDSIMVEGGGKSFCLRLYYVDCPETTAGSNSDAQRVREQTRYFGLPGPERIIHFGNEAKTFIEKTLHEPFTVHTAFASALGRSANGRVYGFITTAKGDDLAELLIKKGLARTRGIGRKTPNGVPRDEMIERLRDLEISAILKRVGIWEESDSDRIAELRALQRNEESELQKVKEQVVNAKAPQGLLDINTATEEELQTIKTIGPARAKRIIAGRPYKTVEDLLKVKGIGPKSLEAIRAFNVVGE
ncbi:MAG: helix-hairpin-helix domain-containing protein [Kiritimatiellae bacterium]|jgi:competence protein ComEA|nr:helix-hairpin-helix domain-containing protein [Kiritimatiellia bacterium]